MNARFDGFCGAVCAHVKHATPEERSEIARELTDHLTDHAEALQALGRSPEESGAAAVAAMGDPAEIGEALNRQYPLLWLVLSRAALVLIAVLALQLPGCLNGFYHAVENLRARWSPASGAFAQREDAARSPVDYRFQGPGNDVIYIYALDIVELDSQELRELRAHTASPEGRFYAHVSYCVYDRNPFGRTSQLLSARARLTNGSGDSWLRCTGGGSVGACYKSLLIPVEEGEPCLCLDYSGFGYEVHETIPLDWEGAA